MAPILIDNRGMIKLGFIAVIVTTLTFSGGFVSGYQQATTHSLTGSEIESLILPVKDTSLASEVAQQKPETVELGEIIDVDQAEPASTAEAVLVTKAQVLTLPETLPEVLPETPLETPLETQIATQSPTAGKEELTIAVKPSVSIDSKQDLSPKKTADSEATVVTNDVREEAKYSAQVGVYGRLANAEKMVEKLQSQNLNAYVSDYLNRKKEVRFNVRFGYFADRKTAITALRKYREQLNGDGYLVNFTVDRLTHLAATKTDPGTVIEFVTATASAEPAQADVIHTEITETSAVLTKTNADNSEQNLIKDAGGISYN